LADDPISRNLQCLPALNGATCALGNFPECLTARSPIPPLLALSAVPVKSRGDHAGTRAELHRLRAIDCAAKTQRDPDATLN